MDDRKNRIFISYCRKDSKWLKLFQTHLAPLERAGFITWWDDGRIDPGGKWKNEFKVALAGAKVGLLLVTPNFLASNFIARHELPSLLGGTTVFWVAVSASSVKVTEIWNYQAANDPDRPLDTLRGAERNQVLVGICDRLLQYVDPSSPPRIPLAQSQGG